MQGCVRCALTGLLAIALAGVAWIATATAQQPDHPAMLPTRDVTVTYRVDGVDLSGAHKMQITYTRSGVRTRIDYFHWVEAKYPFVSLIFDRPANRSVMVMPEQKGYTLTTIGDTPNRAALLKPWMEFERKYESSIAKTSCTQWEIRRADRSDYLGGACVTNDGVVLHLTSNAPGDTPLTAISVSYGQAPEGFFLPPGEYTRLKQ